MAFISVDHACGTQRLRALQVVGLLLIKANGGEDHPVAGLQDHDPALQTVCVILPMCPRHGGRLAPSRQGGGTAEMAL